MGDDLQTMIEALRVIVKMRANVDAMARMHRSVSDDDRRTLDQGIRLASSVRADDYLAAIKADSGS